MKKIEYLKLKNYPSISSIVNHQSKIVNFPGLPWFQEIFQRYDLTPFFG